MAAPSIADRFQAIETLGTAGTAQAVPQLAGHERQVTGWGCMAVTGVVGFGAFALALLLLTAALIGWLAWGIQLVAAYLQRIAPESADLWLAVILLASGLIVFFSDRWRNLMRDRALWGLTYDAGPVGAAHAVVAALSRVGITLLAGSFLPFTLFAPVYVLTQWRGLSAAGLTWARSALPPAWGPAVDWLPWVLLALSPLIFVDWKRRAPRRNALALAFVLCVVLAFVWLAEAYDPAAGVFGPLGRRLWPFSDAPRIGGGEGIGGVLGVLFLSLTALAWRGLAWVVAVDYPLAPAALFLFLVLAYPLGLSYLIARIFYLPYAIFRNTLGYLLVRARLRYYATRTLDAALRHNKQQVQGDGWSTVCADHLRRFDELREKRAYFRSAVYHVCPVCKQDALVYNDVACVSVLLDGSMADPVRREHRTLYLNGLRWNADNPSAPVVYAPFEALIIGFSDRFAVEKFVIRCQNDETLRRALKAAPCHIVSGHSLPESLTNMIQPPVVASITPDFALTHDAVPCRAGLREREVGKRVARRGLRWAVVVLLLVAILVALYVGLPLVY